MSETEQLIVDTTIKIFDDLGDPQSIILAGDQGWRAPLWQALEEAGLTLAWVPEENGGAGISVTDGFALLRAAGRRAVAVPLAETLLAGWLLARADLQAPSGALSVAFGDGLAISADGKLAGTAQAVPFARDATHLAVLAAGPTVALVTTGDCRIDPSDNYAGEGRDTVHLDAVSALEFAPSPLDESDLQLMGAAVRAAQMAGALEAILDISVQYAQERIAFERPISRFQAVQHNLARLAEETSAAVAIVNSAAHVLAQAQEFDDAAFIEVASAKIRVGEAAGDGAAIGHQVHGAIGFTREHILHRYTQRLWSWRDDFGDESRWAAQLGAAFAAKGGAALWPTLTAI